MKYIFLCLAIVVAFVTPAQSRSHKNSGKSGSPSSPSPLALSTNPQDLSYDDPAVHYSAPAGFARVVIKNPAAELSKKIVVFAMNYQQENQKSIVMTLDPNSATLAGIDMQAESDLRSKAQGTYIDKSTRTTLVNGMPAYWVVVSIGLDAGKQYRSYEYIVADGKRSITIAYTGRVDDVNEPQAKAALGSLSVVLYPEGR